MSNLVNHFNLKPDNLRYEKDYEIFKDKDELERLKNILIESIIDSANKEINSSLIVEKLDLVTKDMNLSTVERSYLYNLIDNEINGNGPISAVLKDTAVSKIMVNNCKDIYIETIDGILKDDSISFINNDHIINTIYKLLNNNKCYYDKNSSIINAKLMDGSTLFACLPPSVNNPIFTIKKYNANVTSFNEQIRLGSLTPYMARFLEACVLAKLNILVCGSSDSGKSTFLNTFINTIPEENRVIIYDNDNSININKSNVLNINNINVNDLNNLYPDNIVLSSIDNNLLENIMYMNKFKGIIASYTTNNIDYLEDINKEILVTNPLLEKELINYYILNSIDIIVYLEKMPDNKRKVISIKEVNNNSLKTIFEYKNDEFILYSHIPKSYNKIKSMGINLIDDIFNGVIK